MTTEDNTGLVSGEPGAYTSGGDNARNPNIPPCKPIFYHNLNEMPTQSTKSMVKKALYGWFALIVVLCFNFLTMSVVNFTPIDKNGESKSTGYTMTWILSLVLVVAGIPVTFVIYMCLYSAARKTSSMYYCCFFPLFGGLTFLFFLFAVGLPSSGAGGLIELILASGAGHPLVPALLLIFSTLCWVVTTIYSVFLLFKVHGEYAGAGGLQAARKEATRAAATTAYDHREEIKEVAWEHREEIKQVAVDNKDLLIDVAKENQDVAIGLAKDNPDIAWQMAVAAAQSDGPSAANSAPATSSATVQPNVSLEDDINWSEFS